MKKLSILGMGHIGTYVFNTLRQNPNFYITGYDLRLGHDLSDETFLAEIIKNSDGVLASTPFFLNKTIARLCNEYGTDYFDLTESVDVTNYVKTLTNAKFVTQCGLAPGMVNIIAHHMARQYNEVQDIEIRVGALPINANNHMGYYRTWSTEGLINEYIHPCPAVKDGRLVVLEPLTQEEIVNMGGIILEARTTSGGVGSLAETWQGRARNVNYKTLRYPGHWDLIQYLKDDLGLATNFHTFVDIFNKQIPLTVQDCVYIMIRVSGWKNGNLYTDVYSKIINHQSDITAIQLTTGCGVMAVLDSWQQGRMDHLTGWVRVEDIDYDSIWGSIYSECYQ
jgi:saccharopine dehydrogenase-like NADP-dependent oxidoreductase